METVHVTSKGRMLDTLERFYIFRETKLNNQIKDRIFHISTIIQFMPN